MNSIEIIITFFSVEAKKEEHCFVYIRCRWMSRSSSRILVPTIRTYHSSRCSGTVKKGQIFVYRNLVNLYILVIARNKVMSFYMDYKHSSYMLFYDQCLALIPYAISGPK